MIKDTAQFKLTVERVQPPVAARGTPQTYGVASAEGAATGRVIALLPGPDVSTVEVESTRCIAIDGHLSAEHALHVPALAISLWAWETMQLEIGEAALYTAESPFEHFLGETALLRGALPVLQLGAASNYAAPEGVQVLTAGEASELLTDLRARLADSVGFAAVDASGKAEVTDVIFEALPRWGRLLLAAHRPAPINVDFYNNVHRKGIDMRGASLDPLRLFDPAQRGTYDVFVRRAIALLMRRPEAVLPKRV